MAVKYKLPKRRNRLAIIAWQYRAGAHVDRRKKANKRQCRTPIKED